MTAVAIVAVVVGLIIYASLTIKSHGEIVTIGVVSDAKEIDWGQMYANSSKQAIIHIWGNGTVPITIEMSTANWQPATAANYLAYTWDYSGEVIGTDPVPITITLHVDAGVTGFSYFQNDIIIQAKEAT